MGTNGVEALLRNTIDSSMDMIQVFEAIRNTENEIIDFRWILNNKVSEAYYGDVIGKSLLTLNPGVVEVGIFDTFKKVVETGVPDQSVRHYEHEQFKGWFYQSTVKQSDGVATTTKDISDMKLVEEKIRQSQLFLQSVINNSLDIIQAFDAVRDDTGAIIDFTWKIQNDKGFLQNGDVIGKSLLQRNPDIVSSSIFPYMVAVVETGIPYEHEQKYFSEQFQEQWFYQSLVKEGDGIVMTAREITAQKKAARTLEEQAYFIKNITEMMPDVLSVVELPSRKILYTNRDTVTSPGFEPDQINKIADEEHVNFYHPEDLPAIQAFYQRFKQLSDREENKLEYRHKSKEGNWIQLSLRGQVFRRDEDGNPVQALFVGQDVSAQKKAEQEILRLKDEIAQRASDKYYSLFNSIAEGLCIIEMLYDAEGKVNGYRILETNAMFQQQTGIKDAMYKTNAEIRLNPSEAWWVEAYDRVVQTGESRRLENYHEPTGRWYIAYISRVGARERGYIVR
jgi:PAS domain S-box-containing protein